MTLLKVILNYDKNLHFKASLRQFKNLEIDEPISFHGTDLGPSSIEYLLIGIGGCLGTTFVYCLQKNAIPITDLKITIDGKLSHKGVIGKLRIIEVNIGIACKLGKDYSLEKLEKCKKEFQQHCIVTNSLKEGFPIKIDFSSLA